MANTSFNTFIVWGKFDAEEVKEVWELTRTQKNCTPENISYDLLYNIFAFLALLNFNLW